jgi:hypothetical protein
MSSVPPAVQIVQVAGKGQALFATQPMAGGAVIFEERAAVCSNSHDSEHRIPVSNAIFAFQLYACAS